MLNINGKLVYFLLSLLVMVTAFVGNNVISGLEYLRNEVISIQESLICVRSDFESYRNVHDYKHQVLDEKMQTFHENRR